MFGTFGRFSVSVAEVKRGSGKNSHIVTQFVVTGAGIPEGLVLGRESGWRALKKVIAGDDVRVGDPEFDDQVHVEGDVLGKYLWEFLRRGVNRE